MAIITALSTPFRDDRGCGPTNADATIGAVLSGSASPSVAPPSESRNELDLQTVVPNNKEVQEEAISKSAWLHCQKFNISGEAYDAHTMISHSTSRNTDRLESSLSSSTRDTTSFPASPGAQNNSCFSNRVSAECDSRSTGLKKSLDIQMPSSCQLSTESVNKKAAAQDESVSFASTSENCTQNLEQPVRQRQFSDDQQYSPKLSPSSLPSVTGSRHDDLKSSTSALLQNEAIVHVVEPQECLGINNDVSSTPVDLPSPSESTSFNGLNEASLATLPFVPSGESCVQGNGNTTGYISTPETFEHSSVRHSSVATCESISHYPADSACRSPSTSSVSSAGAAPPVYMKNHDNQLTRLSSSLFQQLTAAAAAVNYCPDTFSEDRNAGSMTALESRRERYPPPPLGKLDDPELYGINLAIGGELVTSEDVLVWEFPDFQKLHDMRHRLVMFMRDNHLKQADICRFTGLGAPYLSFMVKDPTISNFSSRRRVEVYSMLSAFFNKIDTQQVTLDDISKLVLLSKASARAANTTRRRSLLNGKRNLSVDYGSPGTARLKDSGKREKQPVVRRRRRGRPRISVEDYKLMKGGDFHLDNIILNESSELCADKILSKVGFSTTVSASPTLDDEAVVSLMPSNGESAKRKKRRGNAVSSLPVEECCVMHEDKSCNDFSLCSRVLTHKNIKPYASTTLNEMTEHSTGHPSSPTLMCCNAPESCPTKIHIGEQSSAYSCSHSAPTATTAWKNGISQKSASSPLVAVECVTTLPRPSSFLSNNSLSTCSMESLVRPTTSTPSEPPSVPPYSTSNCILSSGATSQPAQSSRSSSHGPDEHQTATSASASNVYKCAGTSSTAESIRCTRNSSIPDLTRQLQCQNLVRKGTNKPLEAHTPSVVSPVATPGTAVNNNVLKNLKEGVSRTHILNALLRNLMNQQSSFAHTHNSKHSNVYACCQGSKGKDRQCPVTSVQTVFEHQPSISSMASSASSPAMSPSCSIMESVIDIKEHGSNDHTSSTCVTNTEQQKRHQQQVLSDCSTAQRSACPEFGDNTTVATPIPTAEALYAPDGTERTQQPHQDRQLQQPARGGIIPPSNNSNALKSGSVNLDSSERRCVAGCCSSRGASAYESLLSGSFNLGNFLRALIRNDESVKSKQWTPPVALEPEKETQHTSLVTPPRSTSSGETIRFGSGWLREVNVCVSKKVSGNTTTGEATTYSSSTRTSTDDDSDEAAAVMPFLSPCLGGVCVIRLRWEYRNRHGEDDVVWDMGESDETVEAFVKTYANELELPMLPVGNRLLASFLMQLNSARSFEVLFHSVCRHLLTRLGEGSSMRHLPGLTRKIILDCSHKNIRFIETVVWNLVNSPDDIKAVLRNVVREASLPSSFLSILFPVFISSIYREKLKFVHECSDLVLHSVAMELATRTNSAQHRKRGNSTSSSTVRAIAAAYGAVASSRSDYSKASFGTSKRARRTTVSMAPAAGARSPFCQEKSGFTVSVKEKESENLKQKASINEDTLRLSSATAGNDITTTVTVSGTSTMNSTSKTSFRCCSPMPADSHVHPVVMCPPLSSPLIPTDVEVMRHNVPTRCDPSVVLGAKADVEVTRCARDVSDTRTAARTVASRKAIVHVACTSSLPSNNSAVRSSLLHDPLPASVRTVAPVCVSRQASSPSSSHARVSRCVVGTNVPSVSNVEEPQLSSVQQNTTAVLPHVCAQEDSTYVHEKPSPLTELA